MKKLIVFLVGLFLGLTLCSCSTNTTQNVVVSGEIYTIDTVEKTIEDSKYTYKYTFSGNSKTYTIELTYPDGSEYKITGKSGNVISSGDVINKMYASPNVLSNIILNKAPKTNEGNPLKFIISFFAIGIGILNTLCPHIFWYLEYGWRYKNSEPSNLALTFIRISGVIVIIFGIIFLFVKM